VLMHAKRTSPYIHLLSLLGMQATDSLFLR
jgi:hypothetical protein